MPVTAPRRIGIASQQNAALRNTALEQKKLQDASRTRTRNIAVGIITVAAVAVAAYLGRGYIFGKTPTPGPQCPADAAAKLCEQKFISQYKGNAFGSQFSYDFSKHLKSVDFKKCIAQQNIV